MTDSQTLLSLYSRTGSESAFRELVNRYIDLVYSTAFRLVGGDAQSAQDVAQTVFVALAAKAGTLPQDVMLGGWLHQHARFAAGKLMRTERRRQSRERQAAEMNAVEDHSESNLAQVAPVLDEAIGQLDAEDRTAILLRFFERKDFRGVGDALGSSEDAARKRVDRALEKLHVLLKHRGATFSAAALGTALAAEAVTAAPVGLAGTTAGIALASGAASGGITAILVKLMTITKLKSGIISVIAVAAAGTGIYEAGQASRLRGEVETLQQQQAPLVQQMAQLKSDNEGLSNRLAQANAARSLSTDRLRELLRLRGEVGGLRRQQRELERAVAAAQSKTPGVPGQSSVGVTPPPNKPLPFQLQLVLDHPGDDTESITNNFGSNRGETLHVQKTPLLDYSAVSSATVTRDGPSGAPGISVEFSEVGKELFAAITRENLNKRLAIVLDGQVYSAPVIRSEIPGGKAHISGVFTEEEATKLAAKINEAVGVPR
jgi:RNA polymerase sigma factor (sigma-70 family)